MMNAPPHLQVGCLDGGMEWQWSRLGSQAELLPMDCLILKGFMNFPTVSFCGWVYQCFPLLLRRV